MEFSTSPLAYSPTNGKEKKKKNRMISACSSLSKCSQHANCSHMACELSHPFRVRQHLKTTSNSQEMDFWPSLEMSNEAFVMTDLPTRIQLVSAPPVYLEGWEGRERLRHTDSSDHAGLFSVQYHSFQDVFEINWKSSS